LDCCGCTAWLLDGSASLDELTHSATIGKRITKDSAGNHDEKSVAADAGKLLEDRGCGGAQEETLIEAQKPEWREEAYYWSAGGEKRFERPGDGRMEKENGQQQHDGSALKQRRDPPEYVLPNEIEQDALEREEGSGREHSASEDSSGVGNQMK
jgi:hypothetical protein